jgi:hypothetical protein
MATIGYSKDSLAMAFEKLKRTDPAFAAKILENLGIESFGEFEDSDLRKQRVVVGLLEDRKILGGATMRSRVNDLATEASGDPMPRDGLLLQVGERADNDRDALQLMGAAFWDREKQRRTNAR